MKKDQILSPGRQGRNSPIKVARSVKPSSHHHSDSSSDSDYNPIQRYAKEKPIVIRKEDIEMYRERKAVPTKHELQVTKVQKLVVQKKAQQKQKSKTEEKKKQPEKVVKDPDMIYFTESEDDSVLSDQELEPYAKRLTQVFWRTRNWILLSNQGLFKLLIK